MTADARTQTPALAAERTDSGPRLYIASTSEDLKPHRAAARQVAAELGFETVAAPERGDGRDAVALCARRIAGAEVVLAIVGWRRGEVPGPDLGGDGRRSWTEWEVRSAFRQAKPVVVLAADDSWPRELEENDSEARARMADFRGEPDRLGAPFGAEPEPLTRFRARLKRELSHYLRGVSASPERPERGPTLRLRRWPPPALPERPYPLLLPYTHPDLLGGRKRELAGLLGRLAEPVPILGLHAPSGAGKSSLLGGGLVPWLRAAGRPAAFERHPGEPGLAGRLLGDLLAPADSLAVGDGDRQAFALCLLQAARLAGRPPVLVLDQFEDLLHRGKERARAVVGALLAASAQRQPGYHASPCRWLLAYREEFHGEVCGWLADVLREVPGTDLADASDLPHDFSGPERFHSWSLPSLGTPSSRAEDRAAEAARAFFEAIETPLTLRDEDGELRYRWRFGPGGAERLARAFAEARLARPGAPLVPELQVVLAHLLIAGGEPEDDEVVEIEVPEEPGELIERALEEHLRRALDAAFPASLGAGGRTGRTRALLALRELADVEGRRRQGLPAAALAPAISPVARTPVGRTPVGRTPDGREVLEKLATPQTRLVVLEERSGGWCYVLSHDRMAEVLVRLVDGEGGYAGLGIDAKLLDLRRFVTLRSELFEAGEVEQATAVPAADSRRLERHADALLWCEERQRWWAACRERRRADRRRRVMRRGIAAVVLVLVGLGAWSWADRRTRRRALLEQIVEGKAEAAFAALYQLTGQPGIHADDLLARLRQREKPLDVLERGLGGVGEERRGEAVLQVAELVLPLLAQAPEDPVLIASAVWALDFFALPEATLAPRALALRDAVLAPLRRSHPPPPMPAGDDPDWADIPGGTFWMGSGPGESRDEPDKMDERPRHQVTISALWMMTHEVTDAELRRLVPDRPGAGSFGDDNLPATAMTWYQAYTYAAWLGGRLPTEAEWEYAARAGCSFVYCRRDGSEATLDEVAWWFDNTTDPKTGRQSRKPVMQLEPNPWGLFDVYGNVGEMTADWFGPYAEGHQVDPPGPTQHPEDLRTLRGFSSSSAPKWMVPSGRGAIYAGLGGSTAVGLRVVLPSDWTERHRSRAESPDSGSPR